MNETKSTEATHYLDGMGERLRRMISAGILQLVRRTTGGNAAEVPRMANSFDYLLNTDATKEYKARYLALAEAVALGRKCPP